MIINIAAFVLGVVVLQRQAVLPSILWSYVLLLAVGAYFVLFGGIREKLLLKRIFGAVLLPGVRVLMGRADRACTAG